MIKFTVEGTPIAQPRPKFRCVDTPTGMRAMAYVDSHHPVHAYKSLIEIRCREHFRGEPWKGPIAIVMIFHFKRQASRPKYKGDGRYWKQTKPDVDNLCKSVLDALSGLAFADDNQVATITASKFYGAENDEPYTFIAINEIPND